MSRRLTITTTRGRYDGCAAVILFVGLVAIVSTLNAWLIMLALGALHSHVETVPPLGFAATWLTTVAVAVLVRMVRG